VANNPSEEKFRRLKKTNAKVEETFCKHRQALALLQFCGWQETNAEFVCAPPSQTLVDSMREMLEMIDALICTDDAPSSQPSSSGASNMAGSSSGARVMQNGVLQNKPSASAASSNAGYANRSSTPPPKSSPRKPAKSAFDFERRVDPRKQEQKVKAEEEDIRALRRQQFEKFQKDPNAAKSDVYQQPPSIAPGGKTGGWFSGGSWFGSSDGDKKDKKKKDKKDDRRGGPNIRGVGDLPKPPRQAG